MKIVLHATFAYAQTSTHDGFANYGNDQISMYNAIIDATSRVARDAVSTLLYLLGQPFRMEGPQA